MGLPPLLPRLQAGPVVFDGAMGTGLGGCCGTTPAHVEAMGRALGPGPR